MPEDLLRVIGAACLDNEFREDLFNFPTTIDKRYVMKISEKTRKKLVTLTKSPKLKKLLSDAEQIICTNAGTEDMDCFFNRVSKRKAK